MSHPAANTIELPRVLCVDDEPDVLKAMARVLRAHFEVSVAQCAGDALATFHYGHKFAVLICDLQLPDMNGIQLLEQFQDLAPTTVRMLVTGKADMDAAVRAINTGHVFGFLQKPYDTALLVRHVIAAAEHHRLLEAERALLEETLHGSIHALTNLLGLSCPAAFGRGTRLTRLASDMTAALNAPNRWEIEVAAMLSQIGCVTLPTALVERMQRGEKLDATDQALIDQLPAMEEELLAPIPRLEGVSAILRYQNSRFDGYTTPNGPRGKALPLGARVLKILSDFDILASQGKDVPTALAEMAARTGWYDLEVFGTFSEITNFMGNGISTRTVLLSEVQLGMVFGESVVTTAGTLLIARGQDVTSGLLARIRSNWGEYAKGHSVRMICTDAE